MFQASLNYNNVLEVCGWVGLQDLSDPLLLYYDRVFKHCMLQDPAFIHADFGNILMNFTIWLGIIDVVIALFVPQQISQTGILKNGFF